MNLYITRTGDKPKSIAERTGTDINSLLQANQLTDESRLTPGIALIIPKTSAQRRGSIEINAFAPTAALAPMLTYSSSKPYIAEATGELTAPKLCTVMREFQTVPCMTVANLSPGGGYSGAAAHEILSSLAARERFFASLDVLAESGGYMGVTLCFLRVYPFDRDALSVFIKQLESRLHRRGMYLITAVPPSEGESFPGAYDLRAIGSSADRVIYNCFDYAHEGSLPGAISPVSRIRPAVEYALERVPAGKLLLGFSYHACGWPNRMRAASRGETVSSALAVNTAVACSAHVDYGDGAHFSVRSAGGGRVVYYDDPRSAEERLRLVGEYSLAGISLRAGDDVPLRYIISGEYDIEKLV